MPRRCAGVYPGPVRGEPVAVLGAEPVRGEPVDQLGRLPALREAERAQPALDQGGHQARRLTERAGADAELLVEQLGIPERDRPLRARRCVVADHGDVEAEQRVRELARVRDRRGGEQELRLGAVDPRDPPQPAEDVADVGTEDAAVDVRLVDHHVGEVREHVAPAVVVGQDADVEHVGVRQDEVRPLADLPAALGLGIAVVDRRPDARHLQRGQGAELILGERLRRVEVERAPLRLAGERVEHGQVEGERLPARCAGDDRDVLAAPAQRPRPLPGARRARGRPGPERAAHLRREGVGEGRAALRARAPWRRGRAPRLRGSLPGAVSTATRRA